MSPINRLLLVIAVLFIAAVIYGLYYSSDLIKNKRATGRFKDLGDIENLNVS